MIILLSLFGVVVALNFLITGNPSKFFLGAHALDANSETVEKVGVDFEDGKIYLNVSLRIPV